MSFDPNFEQARFNMIEQQIRPWDVLDPGVLSLLAVMRREDFVPAAYRALAFMDTEIPLPTLEGTRECMLSPKVEARLLQEMAVARHETVLEIGAGSGYMAALLAHRARQVISLEIHPELARFAADNLRRASVVNASVRQMNGAAGLPGEAPFDVIMLSGSVASVPAPLLAQLKVGGRLGAIVGQWPIMRALRITRTDEHGFSSVELFDTVAPRLHGFDEPSRFHF
jgi:protein-L-isoaspartate(D-aspartate) O-methyltransferase